ncbi:MAG: thioredoxin [Calditrichaeota bacterium]|nr:thioredoxin [Calditrichota bacterium]
MSRPLPKSFDELVRESHVPVLVDFWAEWCGPCHIISPSIKTIAAEHKNDLLTVKVNVDEKQHIAAKYRIQSIPTVMMFNKGQVIMRLTGALPYPALKSEVEKALQKV